MEFIQKLTRKKIKPEWGGQFLTLEQSYHMRGIAMLMIITAHLSNHLKKVYGIDTGYLWLGGEFGNAIFLFMSGYGIYLSMMKRGDDLSFRYLWQHIVKIMVPFIIAFMVTFLGCYIMGDDYGLKKAVNDFFTMTIPFTREWFLKAIIMLYVFAFIAFKITKTAYKRIMLVAALSCVYCIVAFYVGLGTWMYDTILCFAGGMFVAKNQHVMEKVKWKWMFVVSAILFAVSFWLPLPLIKNILYGFFLALTLVYGLKLTHLNSRVLHFAGQNSILLYLFHIGFVHIHYGPIIDPILTASIALALTFIYLSVKKYIDRLIVAIS